MKFSTIALAPILAVSIAACAHRERKEHDHDASTCPHACDLGARAHGEMTGGPPGSGIKRMADDVFSMAPGLTDVQRQKLSDIVRKTASEGAAIRMQINDAKTDLFKAASSKAFASKEVTEIRDKITKLDQKRLTIMYQALADVQAIVGFGPEKEELYRRLREYDHPREGRVSQVDQ